MKPFPSLASFPLIAAFLAVPNLTRAEWVVVCNDAKSIMVNGRAGNAPNPAPDTLAIIDLGVSPPRLVAEIEGVPSSVTGPPVGLAVTPDEGLALVVSATKANPENAARSLPDDRVTIVDLKAKPPKIVATLQTGTTPTGVAVNRQGTLALVGSRTGAITIFRIEGKAVALAGKFQFPGEPFNLSNLAFSPDGKSVVAVGADRLIFLDVDGAQLVATARTVALGARPYTVDFAHDGRKAAFTVIGNPNGGTVEKVGVVDLRAPAAEAFTLAVGAATPESVRFSPDGTLCAVVEFNGTTRAKDAPNYNARGKLELFKVDGASLTRVGEASIGGWAQVAVFSADNRTLLVTNVVEHEVQVLHWDGKALTDPHVALKMKGAPGTHGDGGAVRVTRDGFSGSGEGVGCELVRNVAHKCATYIEPAKLTHDRFPDFPIGNFLPSEATSDILNFDPGVWQLSFRRCNSPIHFTGGNRGHGEQAKISR